MCSLDINTVVNYKNVMANQLQNGFQKGILWVEIEQRNANCYNFIQKLDKSTFLIFYHSDQPHFFYHWCCKTTLFLL